MVLIGVVIFFEDLLSSGREFQSQIKVVLQEDLVLVAQLGDFCVQEYFLGHVEIILVSSSENTQLDSREHLFDAHPERR